MIEKTIPETSIGTGYTVLVRITPGRTATIKQLQFTNTASELRTIHVFDSSSPTTGVKEICMVVLGANETFVPAETINRKAELGYVVAYCSEGTETSCSGYYEEI
jgi:hypothetical protein